MKLPVSSDGLSFLPEDSVALWFNLSEISYSVAAKFPESFISPVLEKRSRRRLSLRDKSSSLSRLHFCRETQNPFYAFEDLSGEGTDSFEGLIGIDQGRDGDLACGEHF